MTTQDKLNISVDGKPIVALPGQTVLQAALDADIYIPYLCYYPKMKPYGACRTCVVEVEVNGNKFVKASCTEPCVEGMQVYSKSDLAEELRRDIIELLMTEHPHGCLTCHRIELCGPQDVCQRHVSVTDRCTICPKNERCELKDTVRASELDLRTPLEYHRRDLPIHADDPFYDRDYNLCIVCARCVRVCDEVRFDNAITLTSRSGVALVGTSQGVSLMESGCEFCGACIDVCPTGALTEREYKWEKATREVETTCTNCPVGCGMVAEVNKFNKVVRFKGNLRDPVNVGQACFKGKFGYDYPNSKHRLKRPYTQAKDGTQKADVGWDAASQLIKEQFAKFKPHEIAVFASPRATNEDLYAIQKFARAGLGTPNVIIASDARPELLGNLHEQVGQMGATRPIWDLERAKTIVVISGNPTEEQNVLAVPLKRAAREGANIIVIDSRETDLTRYAKEWVRPKPGTEPLVATGVAKVIIDESLGDNQFLSNNKVDNTELSQSLWHFDVSKLAEECGLEDLTLRQIAHQITKDETVAFVVGTDNLDATQSVELSRAVANVAILTGNVNKMGSGIYPLYDGANALGAYDMGSMPQFLPGGDADALAKLWNAKLPKASELTNIQEFIDALQAQKFKAALIFCDGINLKDKQLAGLADGLKQLQFVAASAAFASELTQSADVVLPAKTYAEQEGTLTNLAGDISPLNPLWDTPIELKNGWETVNTLGKAFGFGGLNYKSASAVMDEIKQAVPRYATLNVKRLKTDGVFMCERPETPYALRTLPLADSGVVVGAADKPTDALVLCTGRVLHQNNRPAELEQRDGLNYIRRVEQVHIHPINAKMIGAQNGDELEIKLLKNGSSSVFKGEAVIDSPHADTLYITKLFAELVSLMQDGEKNSDRAANLPKLDNEYVQIVNHKSQKRTPKPRKKATK